MHKCSGFHESVRCAKVIIAKWIKVGVSPAREGQGASVSQFAMTINGAEATTAATFPVEDPATNEVIAHAPECTDAQMDQAMRAADEAHNLWRQDRKLRQAALEQLAAATEARLEDLAAIITSEEGKPLGEARSELGDAVNDLRYFASLDLDDEVIRDDHRTAVRVVRRPFGPVAAITPWNFPLGTAVAKIAPALAAGCTMVLKPSPYTPLSCLLFGEVSREVLPPGVLNVISGGNDLGVKMTEHPVPRMVSFTGSVATGKKIATTVAPDLKRVTLELGGNDPAIVLEDFDVESTAAGLFANAFSNCGQVCVAIKRVYVPRTVTTSWWPPWRPGSRQPSWATATMRAPTSARCAMRCSS